MFDQHFIKEPIWQTAMHNIFYETLNKYGIVYTHTITLPIYTNYRTLNVLLGINICMILFVFDSLNSLGYFLYVGKFQKFCREVVNNSKD